MRSTVWTRVPLRSDMAEQDAIDDRVGFFEGMTELTDRVFTDHPRLTDHRGEFPWLTGSLGDPFAPVWFVAENPSLAQVRRVTGATVGASVVAERRRPSVPPAVGQARLQGG